MAWRVAKLQMAAVKRFFSSAPGGRCVFQSVRIDSKLLISPCGSPCHYPKPLHM